MLAHVATVTVHVCQHSIGMITCSSYVAYGTYHTHLIVTPWARVVCLIYTPKARGLRVYISGEP